MKRALLALSLILGCTIASADSLNGTRTLEGIQTKMFAVGARTNTHQHVTSNFTAIEARRKCGRYKCLPRRPRHS